MADDHLDGVNLICGVHRWDLRTKLFKNNSSPKTYTYLKIIASQLLPLAGMFAFLFEMKLLFEIEF